MTHVAYYCFNTVFDCCWFLCILLVCDICCLCGLINTLINDSSEAVYYRQIMYRPTFLLITTAVVVPLY